MIKEVMTAEVAGIEVKKWLDNKGIRPTKRAAYEAYISELVQAVMYGEVAINEDATITQKLNFPVLADDKTVVFDKLDYVSRLTAQKMREALQGVPPNDDMANTIAIGAALTGKAGALIGKMDTADFGIVAAIGVFFT